MIEKLKELTKDTAIYGLSTIVGRFLGFLLIPFYTNVFTTSEFGIYANVYAYVAFFNIIYIYGMDSAFLKYSSLAEEEKKKATFSTPFLFVFFTSSILSLILFLTKDFAVAGMQIPDNFSYLIYYVIFILLMDSLALIPFAHLRLQRKASKFALVKILNIIINIALNLILILKYNYGIEAIFISNLAASAFSFIALAPEILKYLELKINKEILRKMLKFGIPYLPASMAATVVQVIDRPILKALTNDSTVGIYQANYKLGIFMLLFVSMFQYAWQPFFLNNAKEKNAKELFSKVLTLFIMVAGFIWILISLFIDDLVSIEIAGKTIIGREFLGGLEIVPVILLGYIFHGIYVNFTAGIYIEEKTKYFPYITGAGAAVNVIVNLTLIPVLGIMGAAFATLASYLVMSISLFFVSQKFYKINYNYNRVLKLLGTIITIGIIYYYLLYNELLNLPFKFLLLFMYFGSLVFFRILKKEEIETTIRAFMKKG